ncbi:hypothetical protein [Heyndrickxia camelliae]|uniref:hypothetical protein n=1 Tax=Heyndrickxia camelliae TaxID=1707093 RepID=UPI0013FE217C|nr:hypothetical protein [Heyndrickxia camelliae]
MAVFSFLAMLIYLVIFLFIIYFVISVLRFMKDKITIDKERNEKLDELIKFMRNKDV